jgi:hypothetical protein
MQDTPLSPLLNAPAPMSYRPVFGGPRPTSCALCCVQEASLSTAVASQSEHLVMRRIMGIELANFGSRPDNLIYQDIANAYNSEVRDPMLRAGIECKAWTRALVQEHFDKHVDLVPRRVLARHIRRLEKMAVIVDAEVAAARNQHNEIDGEDDDAGSDIIDARIIKKQIDIAKATTNLVKEYRIFQREDQTTCGIDNIMRSVQLGQTSVQDAQRMLEIAALARCSQNSVEMPRASELFE